VQDITTSKTFYNFSLFDGIVPQVRHNCWIETADGHIRRLGTGTHLQSEGSMDLGGLTVIPGLIDAHVHLMVPFIPEMSASVMLSLSGQIRLNLTNCIRSGVTTVRDTACAPGLIRRMKRWVAEGKAVGPRILCTNSMIVPPKAMPESIPTLPLPIRLLLGGQLVERVQKPQEARNTVRRMVEQGADWIKTTHTDKAVWLNRPDPPVFDDACFEALVDEAHKQNRPVAMHQTQTTGFRKALDLRVDSMEHTPLDALTDEDISRMVDMNIPIVPTIRLPGDFLALDRVTTWMNTSGKAYLGTKALFETRALLELYQEGITPEMGQKGYYPNMPMLERQIPVLMENVSRLHAAGAIIGCGTDSGGGPFAVFGRICDEIDYLLEAGLSPFEALRSATMVNARILHLDDKLGTLEPGKLADFVALEGNPLADIKALRRVKKVVKEGEVILSQ